MHTFTTLLQLLPLPLLLVGPILVSAQWMCGGETSTGCPESYCCSPAGFCGLDENHCGRGCQPGFGSCWTSTEDQVVDAAVRASITVTPTSFLAVTETTRTPTPSPTPTPTAEAEEGGWCGQDPSGESEQVRRCATGQCCSQHGYCGPTEEYCGAGCQSEFGSCFETMTNDPIATASDKEEEEDADEDEAQSVSIGPIEGNYQLDDQLMPTFHVEDEDKNTSDHQENTSNAKLPTNSSTTAGYLEAGSVIYDCLEPGMYALTFDDGPTMNSLRNIRTLRRYNAKATFFLLGKNLDANPDIAKRIYEEGHEIGVHSWTHPDFQSISVEQMREEMEKTVERVQELLGVRPKYFRFPYGSYGEEAVGLLRELGMIGVQWNLDTLDWQTREPFTISNAFMDPVARSAPGKEADAKQFLALAHDLYFETAQALPRVLRDIQLKQFRLVTISECFGDKQGPYLKAK